MSPERATSQESWKDWREADLKPHGEIGQFLCRLSSIDGRKLWAIMRPYSKYLGCGSVEVPLFDIDLPDFAQKNCQVLGLNPNSPSGGQAWWALNINDGDRVGEFLCVTNTSSSRQEGLQRKQLAFRREASEAERISGSRDSHLHLGRYIDSALKLTEQFTHAFPEWQIEPVPPPVPPKKSNP